MRLITICCTFVLFVLSACERKTDNLTTWNIYRGEIENFYVLIEETKHEQRDWEHIVHLTPSKLSCAPLCGLSGHRDGGLGGFVWDRLFRCGFPQGTGCNAVVRTGMGWLWEPCPADRDRLTPFTADEIAETEALLNEALSKVYRVENREDQLAKIATN